MALCCQIIYLVGAYLADNAQHTHGVAQVCIVQMEMGGTLEVSDALTEIDATATDGTMDLVAFFQQELSQVTAVLACNTSN